MSAQHGVQWLLLTAAFGLSNGERLSAQEKPSVDLYGDPLPAGAIARLGTLQFRHGTSESLSPLAFSKDGKRLLSASNGDQTIRIWDAATGKQLQAIRFPDPESYTPAIAFSADGNSLALAGPVAGLHFWNADRDKAWTEISKAGSNRGLSMTADGRLLAASENNGPIRLWESKTGKELPRTFEFPGTPYEVLLSSDGKLLAAAGESVVVWDVASGKELHKFPTYLGGVVAKTVAISHDNKLLAAPNPSRQGLPSSIALWDLASGKKIRELPCDSWYFHAIFSADGKSLLTAGSKSICVWDVASGKERRKLPSGGYSPVFSPDGRTLAYRRGATIHLWDVQSGRPFPHRQGHQIIVRPVVFSPNSKLLASAAGKEVILWDTATSKQLHLLAGHESWVNCVAFSTDGKTLVTASNGDRTIRRWNVATGKEIKRVTVPAINREPGKSYRPAHFKLSHDLRILVLVHRRSIGPNDIQGWDVDSGKELFKRRIVAETIVAELLSREGKPMYSENLARVLVATIPPGPLAHSPDGKIVARGDYGIGRSPTGSEKKRIEETTLWEAATGLELIRIPTGPATDMAFSPDGRLLLTSRPDALLQLWDIATGKELLREPGPDTFNDHLGTSFSSKLGFSPDGHRVATGLLDSTILIWDVNPARWKAKPIAPALSARELDSSWADLRGADGGKVHAALWSLVAGGKPAMALLKERLTPTAEVDAKRIRQLIADLASERFAVRDAANRELRAVGEQAEALLRASLVEPFSVETRRRVESVLDSFQSLDSPELLRRLRAIQALELIGTAQAKEILAAVARGAARARETREAQAALQRLGQRTFAPAQLHTP